MNKLIIIGNGFDLAHGYPTRYSDFILWLVKRELKVAFESHSISGKKENSLFECAYNRGIHVNTGIEDYIEKNFISILQSSEDKFANFVGWKGPTSNNVFYLKAKSNFVKLLFRNTCENWVDIEQIYYKCLKEILPDSSKRDTFLLDSDLKILNEQLTYLCQQLRIYLSSLPRTDFVSNFQEILNKPIDYDELFKPEDWKNCENIDIEELKGKSKTYILNFNYTNTVEQYFQDKANVTINNIHGSIADNDNPMIFGYGDELDDDFAVMEKQEIKGFLEHVKSLWYLRTRNYHNLIRFIESDYYQVQVFGHSCGRSDRTLLNMVFEHDNCNSVNIYYRKKENDLDSFNEISEEISRQFKDKQKLRKRVLPKNAYNIIPQKTEVAEEKLNVSTNNDLCI